jgi:hypothetical protein
VEQKLPWRDGLGARVEELRKSAAEAGRDVRASEVDIIARQ